MKGYKMENEFLQQMLMSVQNYMEEAIKVYGEATVELLYKVVYLHLIQTTLIPMVIVLFLAFLLYKMIVYTSKHIRESKYSDDRVFK